MKEKVIIHIDQFLVSELFYELTRSEDEAIAYCTGPEIEKQRVVTTYFPIELEKSSPVYARGSYESCRDTLVEMADSGFANFVIAHSHPGYGPSGCVPSVTDINYKRSIQNVGAKCIGMIFARDGWFRFFTVSQPFEVVLHGEKIIKGEGGNVYRLLLAEEAEDEDESELDSGELSFDEIGVD